MRPIAKPSRPTLRTSRRCGCAPRITRRRVIFPAPRRISTRPSKRLLQTARFTLRAACFLPPTSSRNARSRISRWPSISTWSAPRSIPRAEKRTVSCISTIRPIEDFGQAIKLRLDNWQPYLGRGIARAELRQYRDAVEDFDLCIARKPDSEECYVERALAFSGVADYTHAQADLSQALKLNTGRPARLAGSWGGTRAAGRRRGRGGRLFRSDSARSQGCPALHGAERGLHAPETVPGCPGRP